ncbi:glycosyltransferase [Chloroflexota bacterium]
METVAQCLWVKPDPNDYYPFVADQICNLTAYRSIILTYGEGHHPGYQPLPVYAPYSRDSYRLLRISNRIGERVFGSPWLFAAAIRKHRVKLLHAHMGPYGIRFLPIKKRFKLPLITSFHGYDVYSFPKEPRNLAALRQLFEEGEMFTAVSEHMRNDLINLGCPGEKILVHHVGVDITRFQPRPRSYSMERRIILTVGNFQEKKGFLYLVKALDIVRRKFPKVGLCVVGEALHGNEIKTKVEDLIDELGLRENVVLAGYLSRPQLIKEYAAADLFALPSITARNGDKEGVPTVLMEAQASGLPVVSTDHSGIPEVVLDGKSGYLVPEKDVDQLAERICLLLDNPQDWEEMGRIGRAHIEKNFNVATQIGKLEDLYDGLIS